MHGEKWDLVSKGVPTRSYHQVRQRLVFSPRSPSRRDRADGLDQVVEKDRGV
jgi:hypothetical protein